MAENEDVPYSAPGFAISEDENEPDEDQPNKSVLLEIQKYFKEAIAEHNTLDVIDLTEVAKMTPTQQVAVHKFVVSHLNNAKRLVDKKIKELK